MKIKIYEEERPEEVFVALRLMYTADGVEIAAVDSCGRRTSGGSILSLNKEGTFTRFSGVNESLNFLLDHMGRIQEDEESKDPT